jgi:hypothetical protein
MGFNSRNKEKERLEGSVYHIFAVARHVTRDGGSTRTHLVRRISYANDTVANLEKAALDPAKAETQFVGFGIRVYKGGYAFAFRDRKQVEIQTRRVRSCIVVSFTNFTRRIVGLLHFEGSSHDGHLLAQFMDAADRETRAGDRTRIEIHGGGPAEGEVTASASRRWREVLLSIDGIVHSRSWAPQGPGRWIDRNSCVRWTPDCEFTLQVQTWDGEVSVISRDTDD